MAHTTFLMKEITRFINGRLAPAYERNAYAARIRRILACLDAMISGIFRRDTPLYVDAFCAPRRF